MEYFPFIEVFAQCVYAQMDENKRGRIKKYVKEMCLKETLKLNPKML